MVKNEQVQVIRNPYNPEKPLGDSPPLTAARAGQNGDTDLKGEPLWEKLWEDRCFVRSSN